MLDVFGGVRFSAGRGDLSRGSRIQRWWRWLFSQEVDLALADEAEMWIWRRRVLLGLCPFFI